MKQQPRESDQRGSALITVIIFAFLTVALAATFTAAVGSHSLVARRQISMEKAFCVAEGGAERAIAYLASGGNAPAVLTGTIGQGTYCASIMVSSGSSGPGTHTVTGRFRLNPAITPGMFSLTLPDGSQLTAADLHEDFAGYKGAAVELTLQPIGAGNALIVDGSSFQLRSGETYVLTGIEFDVNLYNDNIVEDKALGLWFLRIDTKGGSIESTGGDGDEIGAITSYVIVSHGSVYGITRRITVEGLARDTWARYALWSSDNREIYFKDGEEFDGRVHSNTRLYFSVAAGSTNPPTFHAEVTSVPSTVGPNAASADDCIFDRGLELGVPREDMTTVSFADLRNKSSLVVSGTTRIVFQDDVALITNPDRGWVAETVPLTEKTVFYVADGGEKSITVTNTYWDRGLRRWVTDVQTQTVTDYGDVEIEGAIDGRVTLVSDRDVNITDHLAYVDDPKTNAASNDALGIIANRNIVVKPSCPDNLNIYAHMMATGLRTSDSDDGSFGVENYASGSPRGSLIMHGGIVQDYRGAVGTFSTSTGQSVSGYDKNYTYDTRFAVNPPPHYPPLSSSFICRNWRDAGS